MEEKHLLVTKEEEESSAFIIEKRNDELRRLTRNRLLIGLAVVFFILAALAIVASACASYGVTLPLLFFLGQAFMTCCAACAVSPPAAMLSTYIVAGVIGLISAVIAGTESTRPGVVASVFKDVCSKIKQGILSLFCDTSKRINLTITPSRSKISERIKGSERETIVEVISKLGGSKRSNRSSGRSSGRQVSEVVHPSPIQPRPRSVSTIRREFEANNKRRGKLQEEITELLTKYFRKSSKTPHPQISRSWELNLNKFDSGDFDSTFFKRFQDEIAKFPDLAEKIKEYEDIVNNKEFQILFRQEQTESEITVKRESLRFDTTSNRSSFAARPDRLNSPSF